MLGLGKPLPVELVPDEPPVAGGADDRRLAQHAQVLRHPRARHGPELGELARRRRPVRQPGDQRAPRGVAECGEQVGRHV
jgi:hypothetical protein